MVPGRLVPTMNLDVVVLDYDGTVAEHGVLNPEVRLAIADICAVSLPRWCGRCCYLGQFLRGGELR